MNGSNAEQDTAQGVNPEEERRKNVRIAIGIAAAGIIGGMLLLVLIIAMVFVFPFTRFFPLPDLRVDAVGLNGKLLLFSEKLDFEGASLAGRLRVITTMREFDGDSLSRAVEIRPYNNLAEFSGRFYFFDSGLYRTYDGSAWEEVRNNSIGEGPRGAVGPEGIWVLARIEGVPALKLVRERETEAIPFPEGGDTALMGASSSTIVWFNGGLHMFFYSGNDLLHSRYRGSRWDSPGSFSHVRDYETLVYGGRLMLFVRDVRGGLQMSSFDGESWSASEELGTGMGDFSYGFHALVFNGRPAVLTQGLLSKELHIIGGGPGGAVRLDAPSGIPILSGLALFFAVPFLFAVIVVFVMSMAVNRYKSRHWRLNGMEVEFAGFFRRFLAHGVDAVIISLPVAFAVVFMAAKGIPAYAPLRLMGLFFLLFAAWLVVALLYFSLLEGVWGRTVGKKLCGILVLRDDFTRCTIGSGFIRNILRVVDGLFCNLVGAVSVGATLKWQRFGDLAAGTVVVRDGKGGLAPTAPPPPTDEGQGRP